MKGINALGNQLSKLKVNQIDLLPPLPYKPPTEIHADELDVIDEEEFKIKPFLQSEAEITMKPISSIDEIDSGVDEDSKSLDAGQTTLF